MKKGTRVKVYQKPITLEDFEDEATVTKVISSDHTLDVDGNDLFYCEVRFDGEKQTYSRKVSVVLEGVAA